MAEALAAFYAVETVAEGAAVGAYAVSKSTTPLHLRFRKLSVPASSSSSEVKSTGQTMNVVKGKAYVFGGESSAGDVDNSMTILTLPSDIENGELDYQVIQPEFEGSRPLQAYAAASASGTDAQGFEKTSITGDTTQDVQSRDILSRVLHCSTSIGSDIFVLGGRQPLPRGSDLRKDDRNSAKLHNLDRVCIFSTQMNKWSVIKADIQKCTDGIPQSRTGASCTSTPHPQPESAVEITLHAHGTIFVHGGYDTQGDSLRDTWAFDVSSRIWSLWPDLPDPQPEEVAGEGRVTCVDKQLWQAGDGFGKMMYINFDIVQADVVGKTSGPHRSEVGVRPKRMVWEVLTYGEKASSTALQGEVGGGSEKSLINDTVERLPVPRESAGFLPVNLGAGRQFLLYFMGQDGPGSVLRDVWSFQIKAESRSAAAIKDAVRSAVGRSTGENQWAPCEVIESTKKEGQLDLPRGLTGFATDSWEDLGGGNIVLYGGVDGSGRPVQQCWVMSVQ